MPLGCRRPGALLEDGDVGGAAACHADCRLAHRQASSCGSAPPCPACKMGYPSITPGAGPTGAAWCGMRSQPPGWPCGGTAPSPVPRPGVLVGSSALAGRRCVQGPAQSSTLGQDSGFSRANGAGEAPGPATPALEVWRSSPTEAPSATREPQGSPADGCQNLPQGSEEGQSH